VSEQQSEITGSTQCHFWPRATRLSPEVLNANSAQGHTIEYANSDCPQNKNRQPSCASLHENQKHGNSTRKHSVLDVAPIGSSESITTVDVNHIPRETNHKCT